MTVSGILCGKTRTSDLVDATVVVVALTHQAIVFTSDPADLAKLATESGARRLVLHTPFPAR
jgi:hypothetical protein